MGRSRGALTASVPVDRVAVSAYQIPTDEPCESDGTLEWRSTTLVLVELGAAGLTGIGYTYADAATAALARDALTDVVHGADVMTNGRVWVALTRYVRNLGRTGVAAMAVSAIDAALWDLKARLLGIPLVTLLGPVREVVPVYGSGGFTSYSVAQLKTQFAAWVEKGIPRVKMKVGRDAAADPLRVAAARSAVGESTELFVDANGAYTCQQALAQAERFRDAGVSWFEEPVYHLDLEGLRRCRDRMPAGMDVAAGEYGYHAGDFARLLEAGAVDVLQADASRCEGITGFLVADAICQAHALPLSAHCAPSLHAHAACAAKSIRHIEYFHDHARIERMFFEGALDPVDGALRPDLSRPGLGLEFRRADACRYAI